MTDDTLARAACLRVTAASSDAASWTVHAESGTQEREALWRAAVLRYPGAESSVVRRHVVVVSEDPASWVEMLDHVSVRGSLVLVADLGVLMRRESWIGRLRPHTFLVRGGEGCALVTRGRWPRDGRPALVLL